VWGAEERRAFDETGILVQRSAIGQSAVDAMRAALWAELARAHGMREHEPASWRVARPAHFQSLARRGAFSAMASPAVRTALDAAFGARAWDEPSVWGQPLVCFPEQRPWELPRQHWHLDFCGPPEEPLVAVRVFAFLDRVLPRGGGTLAVAGSHRLVETLARRAGRALRSAEARRELAGLDPWLAGIERDANGDRVQRFLRDGAIVDGIPLRVVELCGEPGDVTFMRTDTLHAMAPNALAAPRLVVAQFVTRAAGGATGALSSGPRDAAS
jgi:hypothetical protein